MSVLTDPAEARYFEELERVRAENLVRARNGEVPLRMTIAAPNDQIEMIDGKASMFYSGPTPWHGKGTSVLEAATSDQAIVLAGQDWDVEVGNLYGGPNNRLYDDLRCIYRVTDGKPFGVARSRYVPIQNRQMFGFLDSLVEDRIMRYHTAGVLHGGRVVWILAELEEGERIAGEDYRKFLLCQSGHDNRHPLTLVPTDVRVVCNNTMKLAIREAAFKVRIQHTGNIENKFNLAKQALALTTEASRRYKEWLEQLAATKMAEDEVIAVRDGLFGSLDDAKGEVRKAKIQEWLDILNAEEELHPETAYSVVQAITGYADHKVKVRDSKLDPGDERFVSFISGAGDAFKNKGLTVLSKVTGIPLPAAV